MEADDALTQAIEAGRLDETATANVDLTRSFETFQKVQSLFDLLRLPPELAAVAVCIGDTPACVGRYPVVKLLGGGGFGRVVLAYDERLDRQVAIKVAHAADKSLLADAQKAARLRHDRIVTIHAVEETADGAFFVVMEHLEGGTLADRLTREGKLPPEQAVRLVIEIALAVQHAHEHGLVHRDLKPSNILFDNEKQPHVVDFGLAVHESQQADRAGEVAGTWLYMAPEQIRGDVPQIDGRTDIWALGVILYQILTGKHPFSGRNYQELSDQIGNREPRPPRQIEPAIPPSVQQVVLKCLSKRPAERFASAADLVDALRKTLRIPRRMSRALVIAVGFSLIVAAVALAVYLQRTREKDDPALLSNAHVALDGSIDILVWRGQSDTVRGTPIHSPGVAPLRAGDQYRVDVKLTRPAYVYLVSIDAEGAIQIFYPWIPEQGETRPANEQAVLQLTSPPEGGARGWFVTPGRAGTGTILALARETPLPEGIELAPLLADAGEVPSHEASRVLFVNNGKIVSREVDSVRASSFEKPVAIDDPLLAFHDRLAAKLREHFTVMRAVSYGDSGN